MTLERPMSRRFLPLFLPLILGASGCDLVSEEDYFSLPTLQTMFRQEVNKIGRAAAWGSLFGAAAGFVIALLGWQGYRLLACCWRTGRPDPWHSRMVGLPLLFAGTFLGAWFGLLEGGKRQVREALYHGPIGKELLPQLGNAGADLLVGIDQFLQNPNDLEPKVLARFRAGEWKLDVPRLAEKVNRLERASAQQLADFLLKRLLYENPHWQGKLQEALLAWVLPRIAEALVEEREGRALRSEIDPRPYLDNLVARAKAQVEPNGMGRAELSQFFVDQFVVPELVASLEKKVTRTQRYLLLGVTGTAAAALLLGLLVRPFRRGAAPRD
jgi:hypothetical protein